MQNREGMGCPARFLATMVKKLKSNTWNMNDIKTEPKPKLTDKERKAIDDEVNALATEQALTKLAAEGYPEPPTDFETLMRYQNALLVYRTAYARDIRISRTTQ
jgi:hypothetical protein